MYVKINVIYYVYIAKLFGLIQMFKYLIFISCHVKGPKKMECPCCYPLQIPVLHKLFLRQQRFQPRVWL